MAQQPTFTQLFNALLTSTSLEEVRERAAPLVERCNAFDASATDLYPDGDPILLQKGRPSDREPKGNPLGSGLLGGMIAGAS